MPFFREPVVSAWDLCAYENFGLIYDDLAKTVSTWDLCACENLPGIMTDLFSIVST